MSRASDAYESLSNAMLSQSPACAGRDEFTVDSPSHKSMEGMQTICSACPLFDLCRTYADIERPKAGYWAGKTYRSYKLGGEK